MLVLDIVYLIYFYIDDYCTLINLMFLNKEFYMHYMRRDIVYKHKFKCLYHQLFTFLSLLPDCKFIETDIEFFTTLSYNCLDVTQKTHLRNAILFMYCLYKSFIISELCNNHNTNYMRMNANMIGNTCLIQGPKFLDRYCKVYISKNKVKILGHNAKSQYKLGYLMSYYRANFSRTASYNEISNELNSFETFLITHAS